MAFNVKIEASVPDKLAYTGFESNDFGKSIFNQKLLFLQLHVSLFYISMYL